MVIEEMSTTDTFPVVLLCEIAQVSRAAYYKWLKRTVSVWIVNTKLDSFYEVSLFVLFRRQVSQCSVNSNMIEPMDIVP